MNDRLLLDYLADANQYPEHSVLPDQIRAHDEALSEIRERIADSNPYLPGRSERRGGIPRGWLVAVAVFAAVLITGAIVLAWTRQGETPPASPTTSIPLTGAEGDASATEAFALVEATYAAHRVGDSVTWGAALFPPGLEEEGGGAWGRWYRSYAIADQQFDVSQCISHGFGDWEGISDEEPFFEADKVATGYRFECEAIETNAFHSPGGIVVPVVHDWVVADGIIGGAIETRDVEVTDAFNQDYRNWLLANHNDVFSRMEVMPWLFPDENSIEEALQYVGLFVDDSPDWPRQPTN